MIFKPADALIFQSAEQKCKSELWPRINDEAKAVYQRLRDDCMTSKDINGVADERSQAICQLTVAKLFAEVFPAEKIPDSHP